jgi:hypothetical protein
MPEGVSPHRDAPLFKAGWNGWGSVDIKGL